MTANSSDGKEEMQLYNFVVVVNVLVAILSLMKGRCGWRFNLVTRKAKATRPAFCFLAAPACHLMFI